MTIVAIAKEPVTKSIYSSTFLKMFSYPCHVKTKQDESPSTISAQAAAACHHIHGHSSLGKVNVLRKGAGPPWLCPCQP